MEEPTFAGYPTREKPTPCPSRRQNLGRGGNDRKLTRAFGPRELPPNPVLLQAGSSVPSPGTWTRLLALR